MKNIKRNIIIIILISFIVIFFSLKDDFMTTVDYLTNTNLLFIFICIICMLLNILFQSLSIYNLMKKVTDNYTLKKSIVLTTSGLLFNGITPFQSGGQPFQVYMLKKDNIKISDSTNVLLQNFLTYQISLVLIGTIAIIFNSIFNIIPSKNLLKNAVIIGYIINVLVLFFIFFFSYAKKFNKKLFDKILNFIFKFKFLKNKKELRKKINTTLDDFYNGSSSLNKNIKMFYKSFLFNTLSLIFLYIIPLFVFNSMDEFEALNIFNCLVASGYTYLIGSFVPIPGGSGGLEYSFLDFFKVFRSGSFLSAAMLLWRFITYYFGMILGAGALLINEKRKE